MNEGRQRLNVIHQSLVRPVLLAGAERPLAIGNWITAAALILGAGRWYTAALGALLATGGHWALVQAAKIDPQLSQVYIRHFRYQQDCYPARASIWAPRAAAHPADSADAEGNAGVGNYVSQRISRFKAQAGPAIEPARSTQLRLRRRRLHHRDEGRGAIGGIRVFDAGSQFSQSRGA